MAPPVVDLTAQGFTLIGGRLDYVDARPIGAIVYRRRQHVINLFVAQTASTERKAARIETIQGFNIRRWSERGLNYWAVSDLAADELAEFGEKFETAMRTGDGGLSSYRHCEERSDEAIQLSSRKLDCFAALAMTVRNGSHECPRDDKLGASIQTRSFKQLVQTHVAADPAFAEALLREGIEVMLKGDIETGKTILRDYSRPRSDSKSLGAATSTPPKSLIRMFGPRGNPQAAEL